MKFSTEQDIDAPIAYVFQRVTNFDAYERQALRQGAHIVRVDGSGPVGVGATWDVAFTFRSKDRQLRAQVTELTAPESLTVETVAKGLVSDTQLTLVSLAAQTTRVRVQVRLTANSMSARLLLQSLKLAKTNLNNRFRKRVREQLKTVSQDYDRGR